MFSKNSTFTSAVQCEIENFLYRKTLRIILDRSGNSLEEEMAPFDHGLRFLYLSTPRISANIALRLEMPSAQGAPNTLRTSSFHRGRSAHGMPFAPSPPTECNSPQWFDVQTHAASRNQQFVLVEKIFVM